MVLAHQLVLAAPQPHVPSGQVTLCRLAVSEPWTPCQIRQVLPGSVCNSLWTQLCVRPKIESRLCPRQALVFVSPHTLQRRQINDGSCDRHAQAASVRAWDGHIFLIFKLSRHVCLQLGCLFRRQPRFKICQDISGCHKGRFPDIADKRFNVRLTWRHLERPNGEGQFAETVQIVSLQIPE